MPHRCVHCSALYPDAAPEILKGCSQCSGRFFFYLNEEKLKKMQALKEEVILSEQEKKQIEHDVREIVGIEDEEVPVVLDFESIRIVKPGKYVVDLHHLFSREGPLIYTLEDGKYVVDIRSSGKR